MTARKLRIGLLIYERKLLAWEEAMMGKIANSNYAELALIIHCGAAPEENHAERYRRNLSFLARGVRRITYALRRKLEEKVGGYLPDAFAESDEREQVRRIPHLGLIPANEQVAASSDSIEQIRAFDIDVFIALETGLLHEDILNAAKYGTWSVVHTTDGIGSSGAPGFWEVFHNVPVTRSTLRLLSESPDDRKVIGRTCSATCTVSLRRNVNDLYWKASFQIPRKLEELYLLGPEGFFEKLATNYGHAPDTPNLPLTMPRLSDEIVLVSRIFWRIYSNRIRNFFVSSQWILLFDFRNEFSLSSSGFKKIVPPRDRFWADPHVLIKNQRYHVFIEELQYRQKKGHISVMEMEGNGTHTVPHLVLEEPYHLSNPFVFEHDERTFMIPESAKNRTVDLYRCVSFPDKWERCETLLRDVHAVDTTVFFHQGKWWLFTNIREHVSGASDEYLFLFYSNVLQGGQWKAHPRNPIVSDVTRARPAGSIFEHDGKLYRPAQDCSIRYGYGIRVQEILEMSESEYIEQQVAFIEPRRDEKIIATHTFSKADRLVFSDALEERWELFPGLRASGIANPKW